MHARGRAQCLLDPINRVEHDAWAAGAENDGCDNDVQAVEAARGKKARDRIGATLDENTPQAALGESGKDRRWRNAPVHCRQSDDFDSGQRTLRSLRGDHKTPRAVASKQTGALSQPTARIKNDACWMRPSDAAHSELGIVGERGPDADDDGVDNGTKPMQVGETRGLIDVMRMAAVRRHAAIE
jgi:hypothetical protein